MSQITDGSQISHCLTPATNCSLSQDSAGAGAAHSGAECCPGVRTVAQVTPSRHSGPVCRHWPDDILTARRPFTMRSPPTQERRERRDLYLICWHSWLFMGMHRSQSFQSIDPSKRRILSILSICHNTTISGNNLINLSKFEKIFSKFSLRSGAGCTVHSRPLGAPWNIKIKWNKTSLCSWCQAWLTAFIRFILEIPTNPEFHSDIQSYYEA